MVVVGLVVVVVVVGLVVVVVVVVVVGFVVVVAVVVVVGFVVVVVVVVELVELPTKVLEKILIYQLLISVPLHKFRM